MTNFHHQFFTEGNILGWLFGLNKEEIGFSFAGLIIPFMWPERLFSRGNGYVFLQ